MTINWKQGLFAAALLLSVTMLFVGCGKNKTDKAVADKSTGEIIGEEIDVIEVVPAQTPNAKTNGKEQKNETPTAPVQTNNAAPAMTPPSTNPAPATDAPTTQTPEPAAAPDAASSSTTSDVTISTSCSDSTSEYDVVDNSESEPVIESESMYCCSCCRPEPACSPACAPSMEACQPACSAAPACAPEPVCAPAPICAPAPACVPASVCVPVCKPCCTPCRHHHIKRCCRPCPICCRTRIHSFRTCSPCSSACEPACVSECTSACDPACQSVGCTNGDCSGSWSNEQSAPADSTQPQTSANKTSGLPEPRVNDGAQSAKTSTAVGSAPNVPETPSIVLPEAK